MEAEPEFVVERMTLEDLDQVMEIEEASFPTPWPRRIFEGEVGSPRTFTRVMKIEGRVIGYIIAWMVYDEVHVLNLAVHPDYRKRGIGETLLRGCLMHFLRRGAKFALLEVRRSNEEAKRLYEKLGFKQMGVRRRYYADTGEDAIIMVLRMV